MLNYRHAACHYVRLLCIMLYSELNTAHRHGIRASADGHCHIRSLGFQEINVCKDRVGPSRTERSSGDPTGSDRF